MKSPQQLRQTLTKQWQSSQHRIARLLDDGFPIELTIGKPTAKQVNQHTHKVKAHITDWQEFEQNGIGHVVWASHHYRSTNSEVSYPEKWVMSDVETWRLAVADETVQTEIAFVQSLLADSFFFEFRQQFAELSHQQLSILLRNFSLIKPMILSKSITNNIDTLRLVIILANILTNNCAKGLPLRALSLQIIIEQATHHTTHKTINHATQQTTKQRKPQHENLPLCQFMKRHLLAFNHQLHSKFIERQQKLLCLLLSVRLQQDISIQNFYQFLGADKHSAHWLMCTHIDFCISACIHATETAELPSTNWLPFSQMRVRDTDLMTVTEMPFDTIMIVENEQCYHHIAHFQQMSNNSNTPIYTTIYTPTTASMTMQKVLVILGAGNNVSWLQNPLWHGKRLLYWGDIDTWGLAILSQVRQYQPHIESMLMDKSTFDNHLQFVVAEPTSYQNLPITLTADERTLFQYIKNKQLRLEQEFLVVDWVSEVIRRIFYSF